MRSGGAEVPWKLHGLMVAQVDTGQRLRKPQAFQLISTRQLFLVGFLVIINTTETLYFDFIFVWGDLCW